MATITKIEDFDAWIKARELNTMIQKMVLSDSFNRLPDLRIQMQKCSRSVMANLAEGFARNGNAEFIHFISIAVGSLTELKSDCYFCHDMEIVSADLFSQSILLIDDVGKLSNGMSRHLRNSPFKGSKFLKNSKNETPGNNEPHI